VVVVVENIFVEHGANGLVFFWENGQINVIKIPFFAYIFKRKAKLPYISIIDTK